MDRNYNIVPLPLQDEHFQRILDDPAFSKIEAHPQTGRYGRTYYQAYWGDRYHDSSFGVMWQDRIILVVLCGQTEGVLDFYGLPMRIFFPDDLDRHVLVLAVKAAFAHIDLIAESADVGEIRLVESASSTLTPLGEIALGRDARVTPSLIGMVDLTAGPAVWKRTLRKSFHQFVNWGRKNFAIEYVNSNSPDKEKFDSYREFHAKVAGRVTRPRESWDVQFEELCNGRGELVLAYLADNLVAGSLFIDGTEVTIYMTGVYDRDLDKPLAHYLVWHGIERAHGRGMKSLELGDIHLPDTVDDKLQNIGYFKRGFATHFDASFIWTWGRKKVVHQQ